MKNKLKTMLGGGLLLGCLCCGSLGAAQAQGVKLAGKVQNYNTLKPVAFATVSIKKLSRRLVNGDYVNERRAFKELSADSLGQFVQSVPIGEYLIECSALGYTTKTKYVNLKADEEVLIELPEKSNQLEDVDIKAKRAEDNIKSVESSVIKLNIQNIKKLPIVFGEGDLIKALTLQPGVTTIGEGAGGFHVRGGKVDQNLVLLDDAPLYNTSHLLGLFTSVNTEAVQSATLYKAGMPARYGGRLSSLLNINTKTSATQPKKALGIGPISSNLLYQQPFANQKGSVLIAGRAAYPSFVLGALPKRFRGSKASFYDTNVALQYRVGTRSDLKLTGYRSGDSFKFPEDTSYVWNSTAATLQWNYVLSERFSLSTKGILSHYTYGVNGLGDGFEYRLRSTNRHHEVRVDALFQPKNHKIEFGGGLIRYRFSPGTIRPRGGASAIVSKQLNDESAQELYAYVADEWQIAPRVSLQAGLRVAQFSNISEGQVYTYLPNQPLAVETIADTLFFEKGQPSATYNSLEPRASLKVELSDRQSIKASYNRTRQFVHLISNTTAISPIDYWKLSNRYLAPQQADQFSLGLYRNFADNTFETYVEGFYKRMNQLVEYKDGAVLLLNQHLETELLPAVGEAYGIELSVQKNKGRLTGSISYTWSRSLVSVRSLYVVEQINQGRYFPSLFDKPHNINVLGQYYLGKGWTFSGTFVYQTGRPITYPDGQYTYNESLLFNYSKRNLDRLPDFHRLDVSFSRDSRRNKNQQKYNILNISFYNLYARKNPYSIFFRQFLDAGSAYRLAVLGTIVPSLTLTLYR